MMKSCEGSNTTRIWGKSGGPWCSDSIRAEQDSFRHAVINFGSSSGGAVAQLGARLDGIEEVVGSNPIGSTNASHGFLRLHSSKPILFALLHWANPTPR